jgi:hypothetical protein
MHHPWYVGLTAVVLVGALSGPASGDYPRGWAVRRDSARAILQRFGYTKQATILDPGDRAYAVLRQAPRVAERYVGPGGKQWVLTATGEGFAGPRLGQHEIRVTAGRSLSGQDRVQIEVGPLGLRPAPRDWDRPPTLAGSVPCLPGAIRLPGGRSHRLTLWRVGKSGWRTPRHLHPSLGPALSFEMDARGDIRELRVHAVEGDLGQVPEAS